MSSKTYSVPNISCGHCVATIEREVGAVPGVEEVKADLEAKEVMVVYDDETVLAQVENLLEEIGYPAAK
ncbi:MAG: heavy metal transporter [Anaerolineae bacterium]|nr:heavy metal transporter [Anaerolineae bacterium]NIN99855.1 heavy metal transporter [Anaerolineae bacterium]NIQ82630.1 heavy metal transporter [Anaerolineae bacterium]